MTSSLNRKYIQRIATPQEDDQATATGNMHRQGNCHEGHVY